MRPKPKRRDFFSFFVSALVHAGIVLALAVMPRQMKQTWETVDLDVVTKKPTPAPLTAPDAKETPETEQVEPEKPKKPEKPEPPPLAPPEEEVKKEAPEAPPVFDLGDNTFALGDGQGGAWSLRPSEGNTKLAPVADTDKPSVRGTKASGSENGKPGGKGVADRPVPIKDLSKRPEPKGGSITVPPYPAEARREGIEGSVVLQVYIDRRGKVKTARIIKDPGGGLGDVARNAMLKEEWTPPLDKSGNPVDTVIIYSYRFVLET